jgi:2',3'-cyclic-nucleotide 2'-phosphodiesterase (5'-nucleotidase family)
MDATYWHKQADNRPLFPDLIWNRPENRMYAGKLLIVGGNLHDFKAPADAYGEALKAGIGTVRVLLPDALSKIVGRFFPEAEFAPSTPSGSFATQSLAELIDTAEWADGVLIAGDMGRNSETAVLLEKFVEKYTGQLTLARDSTDYFIKSPQNLLQRPDTTLVVSLAQLRQLSTSAQFVVPVTSNMGLLQLVEVLHDLTSKHSVNIVVQHVENIFVAVNGQVSTTKLEPQQPTKRMSIAAHTSTWWLQNPDKAFQALTTGVQA